MSAPFRIALSEGVKMCAEHPNEPLFCPSCEPATASFYKHTLSEKPAVLTLSDVKRDSRGFIDLSKVPDDAVISVDVIRAREEQRLALSEVKEAFMAGKILPPARHGWEKVALSDINTFRHLMSGMKPQANLAEYGLADSGTENEDQEYHLVRLSEQRASADGIPLSEAAKLVAREHPEWNRRRQARVMRAAGVRP